MRNKMTVDEFVEHKIQDLRNFAEWWKRNTKNFPPLYPEKLSVSEWEEIYFSSPDDLNNG